MIGRSLANDFQYTKLKYKQYLQFKCTTYVSFIFLFIQSIYQFLLLFCLLKLVLSLSLIYFYLIYYQDNNTDHHKVISPSHSRNFQVLQKKKKKRNKRKYWYSLQLKGCAHYSLLLKFLVEVKFQISCQCDVQICQ